MKRTNNIRTSREVRINRKWVKYLMKLEKAAIALGKILTKGEI